MNNLCILLNGILFEAESLITEYDKLKLKKRVNKTKMMMLTLQFARYYRLSGEIAKAAMYNSKNKKLTDQLNKLSISKFDGFVQVRILFLKKLLNFNFNMVLKTEQCSRRQLQQGKNPWGGP